jgi:hypothetical protein
MTPDEARAKLEEIRAVAWDYEQAHGLEDGLREAVLRAIAGGAPEAVELATIALETANIAFDRYCA